MVQLTLLASMCDWQAWSGEDIPTYTELRKGVAKFHDTELRTLRRYLPNVGTDKDANAVDSWYMYHPMLNLARLAQGGDAGAKQILLDSLERGIKAARHFNYEWPIQYKIDDFSIITATRDDEGHGQTDVGGIYAYLMLEAFELSQDKRYLDEARAALDAARGWQFELNYQANITAWGAAACLRMWRITRGEDYLRQSYIFLASFFHNVALWESDIGHARHYRNFLGATALHDAPYMAMYECFESFVGYDEYLQQAGPNLDPAVRMLTSEYCKYALDRAWFYYPDTLPKEMVRKGDHQSGVINPNLSFPLEDLYPDGQEAGQVGQEIYGCGAAFAFAIRSHHQIENASFRLYCNQFIRASERTGERAISVMLDGGENCLADLSLVRLPRRKLPKASIMTAGGDAIRPRATSPDRIDFQVPASGRIVLTWV
jgi:hypothetical protein